MLAVGPLGPQYSLLFAWNELGKHAHLGVDTLPTQRVPQKILKKNISLYYIYAEGRFHISCWINKWHLINFTNPGLVGVLNETLHEEVIEF